MNMKKISRILSMVIVVGMIAAIPASTQILSGSRSESSDESNLPMLILVNRLEMSEEQMKALHGILTDLLAEREQIDGLQSEFEDAMIAFSGTGEELDELLATFREDQQALAVTLRESLATSLDQARDILSINQGIVLREALPALSGRDTSVAPDRSMMGKMGQGMDAADSETMREQMKQRIEQMKERIEHLGNQVPEELRERMAGLLGGFVEGIRERLDGRFDSDADQADHRNAMPMQGAMGQRGERGQFSGNSLPMQRLQSDRDERAGEQVHLFEVLEQVAEVLELKLEAME